MDDALLLERRGHVAVLTLNRPERLNALRREDMLALGRLCHELRQDPTVRAVIITGAGRAFSSGADLKAMQEAGKAPFADVLRFAGTPLDFIGALLALQKPTIAAVNGIAVGAGLGIALACDIRLCGTSGAFLANFRDHAIAATDGVPFLLPRLVGVSRGLEILYSGEKIGAREAVEIGLGNRIYPDDELMPRALALAETYAAAAPVALQTMKAAVLGGLGRTWAEAVVHQELGYLTNIAFGAADRAEAQAAKAERRAPDFSCSLPS